MSRRKKLILLAPLAITAFLLFIALGGEIVRQLWNWLAPLLFGWRQISFWQALGILALCRILFGGFGFHGSDRSQLRRRMSDRMGDRMARRWERMTPEERERLRQFVLARSGFGPPASESQGP